MNTDPTAKLADNPDASSYARAAFSWATHGHRDLMRSNLANLSPAHLDEMTLAACILIAAASEIAEDKSPPPLRLAVPCAWCGEAVCVDRLGHERLDGASETTWRRRAR